MAAYSGTDFDFSPGAQVPLTGASGQTAATSALASMAYRDSPVGDLVEANPETTVTPPRLSLLKPNLGEAFSRAVQTRMLGAGREQVVQSFGMEPQTVVEHCLAANRIRQERDAKLTAVMAAFGLVFLPGVLVWLGAFQLRRLIADRGQGSRPGLLGAVVLGAVGLFAVLFVVSPPLTGFWSQYLRVMMVAPVLGWFWARRICEQTAKDLRARWADLASGSGVGAKVPGAVPRSPDHTRAEHLRKSLAELSAEQNSNVLFYAGPKGILGMGSRWGSWVMAEELVPKDGRPELHHQFRSWDVARAIYDRLRDLERGPLHTGGFPRPTVRHWIVAHVGEGAKKVERPTDSKVEAYTVKDFEIQRICNEEQIGSSKRHYLGVQFIHNGGNLVITMLVTVTVLHHTLRVEVSGHALGPIHGLFTTGPAAKEKKVAKSVRFWETRTVQLPLVEPDEVVRLAARAPLTWFPPILDHLGGKVSLPEPFGLRHVWAGSLWKNRFMSDDVLRTATPVLRAVHAAAIRVMEENGVDTSRFTSRSLTLGDGIQGASPGKADAYDA